MSPRRGGCCPGRRLRADAEVHEIDEHAAIVDLFVLGKRCTQDAGSIRIDVQHINDKLAGLRGQCDALVGRRLRVDKGLDRAGPDGGLLIHSGKRDRRDLLLLMLRGKGRNYFAGDGIAGTECEVPNGCGRITSSPRQRLSVKPH